MSSTQTRILSHEAWPLGCGVQEPGGNPGNQNFHGKWLSGPRGGIPLVEADLRRAHVSPKPTATSWMSGGWNEDNVNQPVGIVQHEKIPLVGRFVGRFPLICWTIPTKKYQNYQLVGDSKSFSHQNDLHVGCRDTIPKISPSSCPVEGL